jgi:hypothetical protein
MACWTWPTLALEGELEFVVSIMTNLYVLLTSTPFTEVVKPSADIHLYLLFASYVQLFESNSNSCYLVVVSIDGPFFSFHSLKF